MHNEKLQIADTSFKTHEQQNIFEQPISQLFYEQYSLLTVETSQNILKSIQQEHRFRKLNTLTVNETQLKTKQFPFNIVHLITLIHSTFCFLQQAKLQFLIVKRNSSSYKQMVYKFFQGKSPLSKSNFQIFNYNCRPFELPPKRLAFQFPNASYPFIFSAHAHDWLSNCRTFQSCSFVTIHFVFSSVFPSCDPSCFRL